MPNNVKTITIPYYSIDQLAPEVKQRVCQEALDANTCWDAWQDDRQCSFDAICDALDLQWQCDANGNYQVFERYDAHYLVDWLVGARRCIAYITNRFAFKRSLSTRGHAVPRILYEDNLPTGYCADYCLWRAYDAFVAEARRRPHRISLVDFCRYLAKEFKAEADGDYEDMHSMEYAEECLLADHWFTAEGMDITKLVEAMDADA